MELDLARLASSDDKGLQIDESIYKNLYEISNFETTTELAIRTVDSRLHIYVREDNEEIIQYPSRDTVAHIFARWPIGLSSFRLCLQSPI